MPENRRGEGWGEGGTMRMARSVQCMAVGGDRPPQNGREPPPLVR
jgi:hypothetical protein